jgi:glutamate racemase
LTIDCNRLLDNKKCIYKGCIGLSNRVDKGCINSLVTEKMIFQYITSIINYGASKIVIGCTHYYFLRPVIKKVLSNFKNRRIFLVDLRNKISINIQNMIKKEKLLQETFVKNSGSINFFTTY